MARSYDACSSASGSCREVERLSAERRNACWASYQPVGGGRRHERSIDDALELSELFGVLWETCLDEADRICGDALGRCLQFCSSIVECSAVPVESIRRRDGIVGCALQAAGGDAFCYRVEALVVADVVVDERLAALLAEVKRISPDAGAVDAVTDRLRGGEGGERQGGRGAGDAGEGREDSQEGEEAGRVGQVERIVVGEGVGVGGAEQRVAAEEPADGRVVESRAEVGQAERAERFAVVPLGVREQLGVRGRAG